jgi:hypothetical protein
MAKSSVSSDKISSDLRRTCSGIPSKCGRNECKRSAVAVPTGKLKNLATVLTAYRRPTSLTSRCLPAPDTNDSRTSAIPMMIRIFGCRCAVAKPYCTSETADAFRLMPLEDRRLQRNCDGATELLDTVLEDSLLCLSSVTESNSFFEEARFF